MTELQLSEILVGKKEQVPIFPPTLMNDVRVETAMPMEVISTDRKLLTVYVLFAIFILFSVGCHGFIACYLSPPISFEHSNLSTKTSLRILEQKTRISALEYRGLLIREPV